MFKFLANKSTEPATGQQAEPKSLDQPEVKPVDSTVDSTTAAPSSMLAGLGTLSIDETAASPQPESMDIGNMDTTELEPKLRQESAENRTIAARDQESMASGPEGVRELLDEVDKIIESDDGLSHFNLDATREYVRRLFITLKNQPEFTSVLIDKDVRNVLQFVRFVRRNAITEKQTKSDRKATRAASKAGAASVSKKLATLDFSFTNQVDPDFFKKRAAERAAKK